MRKQGEVLLQLTGDSSETMLGQGSSRGVKDEFALHAVTAAFAERVPCQELLCAAFC